MKTTPRRRSLHALTLTEVLVVIVTAVVLFGVLLPWVAQRYPRRRASRINCVSNVKQVGLAFRMWANDNGDEFPMAASTNRGGTLEFAATGEVFRHFQALSNEMSSPKVLACPNDTQRHRATDFAIGFGNSNVSYFVGLDANVGRPEMILTGDRNITGGTMTEENIMSFRTNSLVGWTGKIHIDMGNIGLADGSAQQVAAEGLRRQIKAVTNEFIRLAIPVTP